MGATNSCNWEGDNFAGIGCPGMGGWPCAGGGALCELAVCNPPMPIADAIAQTTKRVKSLLENFIFTVPSFSKHALLFALDNYMLGFASMQ
jgi:hypothetical protein